MDVARALAATARAGDDLFQGRILTRYSTLDAVEEEVLRADVVIAGQYRTVFLGVIGINEIGFEAEGSAVAISTLDGEEA